MFKHQIMDMNDNKTLQDIKALQRQLNAMQEQIERQEKEKAQLMEANIRAEQERKRDEEEKKLLLEANAKAEKDRLAMEEQYKKEEETRRQMNEQLKRVKDEKREQLNKDVNGNLFPFLDTLTKDNAEIGKSVEHVKKNIMEGVDDCFFSNATQDTKHVVDVVRAAASAFTSKASDFERFVTAQHKLKQDYDNAITTMEKEKAEMTAFKEAVEKEKADFLKRIEELEAQTSTIKNVDTHFTRPDQTTITATASSESKSTGYGLIFDHNPTTDWKSTYQRDTEFPNRRMRESLE